MKKYMFEAMNLLILYTFILAFAFCAKNDIPPVNVSTYKDLVFTDYFKRTSGWVAGDGGYSIALNNGNSLWLWGDSHFDFYDPSTKTVPCLFQVRNAGLEMGITNPLNQSTLVSHATPASYFHVGKDNTYWFWPGAGYQNGDTVYVFLARIKATGSGGNFGFTEVDSNYVAKIKVPDLTVAGYSVIPSKNGIFFNFAVIKDGSYNYVYGIKGNGFGNDLFVARFPAANLYGKWEYYGSAGWSTNIASIQKVHSEFTSSFSICKIKNKYVLITTEFSVECDQGKNIFSYTSDQPFGPFGNKKTIWTVNDTLQGHYPFFYLANAHPEYDNGKDELLVTYCINGYGTCVNTCINNRMNPDYYRPKAIRVPYKLIDSEIQ